MMRVVKVGGRVQDDPTLSAALARAWQSEPGTLCVVHGGGDDVSAVRARLGAAQPSEFVDGRRVTSHADLEILRMVLSGSANKRLTARLVAAGTPALGLSGEDASLVSATVLDDGRLGEVGAPARVNRWLLSHLLTGGFMPVISPVSRNATAGDGSALNVNADDVAAAVAAALSPSALLFISDVDGVLVDGSPRPEVETEEAESLIASGAVRGGMTAKLRSAARALALGVTQVRIGGPAMLLDASAGTVVIASAGVPA
jgi:acetylglutamate kinase